MLDIKTLPGNIERPVYLIAKVGSAYPTFKAGELVDLVLDSSLDELTIRKITGAQPATRTPYPVFGNTAGNSLVENLHRTTVVKREWYGDTDQFEDALAGIGANAELTISGDSFGSGAWAEAVSGDLVFGTLIKGTALTSANGGVITVERIAPHTL